MNTPGDYETSAGLLSELVGRIRTAGTDLAKVEVKAAVGGVPKSVWETVSAFANTSGGVIILGLSEKDGFEPAARFDAVSVREQFIAGLDDRLSPRVLPAVPYAVDIAVTGGAPVVVADIGPLPGIHRPCYVVAQGVVNGSYRRVGDGDRHMSAFEVFMHQTDRAQPVDDRKPVEGAAIDDLDPATVEAYLHRLRAEGRAALEDQPTTAEALERMVVTENGRPTLAGLLALGRFPQRYFPQLTTTVAVFPTVDGTEINDGVRLLDNRTIDGPAPRIIERAVEAIGRNLGRRVLSTGMGGRQLWEIPEGVLREAITNAIMHRDYSTFSLGSQNRVEVFPDRVEIHNPGGVWGGQSIEDLLRGGSHSRNAVLANVLADTDLAGRQESVAENKGTGLRRMVGLMRRAGLPDPQFIDKTVEFVVVLRREPAASIPAVSTDAQQDAVVAALARSQTPLPAADLAKIGGMTQRQIARILSKLIAAGRVEPTAPPRSKNRAYRLADGPHP